MSYEREVEGAVNGLCFGRGACVDGGGDDDGNSWADGDGGGDVAGDDASHEGSGEGDRKGDEGRLEGGSGDASGIAIEMKLQSRNIVVLILASRLRWSMAEC